MSVSPRDKQDAEQFTSLPDCARGRRLQAIVSIGERFSLRDIGA